MAIHQQKVLSAEENLKWLEKYKMGGGSWNVSGIRSLKF